jgi:hypothetical protein
LSILFFGYPEGISIGGSSTDKLMGQDGQDKRIDRIKKENLFPLHQAKEALPLEMHLRIIENSINRN